MIICPIYQKKYFDIYTFYSRICQGWEIAPATKFLIKVILYWGEIIQIMQVKLVLVNILMQMASILQEFLLDKTKLLKREMHIISNKKWNKS